MSKSVMKHDFSRVPKPRLERSVFDRSHGYKTTFDSGYLVPFYVDEALPGDTHKYSGTIFARMNTPIVPIMDNLFMDTFYFAVPLRLLWTNWKRMMGEQDNPTDSIDYITPQVTAPAGGFTVGSIFDYFGLPTGVDNLSVSAFWSRAYNLIYNEWFRDSNLQDSVVVDKGDGPDDPANYTLLRRGKRHDYFTSCLPWPQKGDAVALPLSGDAPIVGIGIASGTATNVASGVARETGGAGTVTYATGWSSALNNLYMEQDPNNTGHPNIRADLSAVTSSTINDLREAFQIQKMLERDARGGTRYTELLKSHFGVISPDSRLQRSEFLGGESTPVNISQVQQTSSTDATSPQGNLAAYATITSNREGFTKTFTEHCVIIGMLSVRADLSYQQGIPRMFSRSGRYDYYWPALAHLGEQPVYNKEIYAQGTVADDDVFGYQERWAEYRYYPSKITGKLRSTYATSLDLWHLAQEFSALPTLSSSFIEDNPPINRVIAVTSEPQFFMDSYANVKTARLMPVDSVPGQIDRF